MTVARSTHEPHAFPPTRWSVVLDALAPERDSRAALETLCSTYWYPLYTFARRRGLGHEEAQDAVQAFFARLLEKRDWHADPGRGRFRSFLAAAMGNFLANERERARALKRGAGAPTLSLGEDADSRFALEAADMRTPERAYEREFALAFLKEVLARLSAEQVRAGKLRQFDRLKPFLGLDGATPPYAELSAELDQSEGALRVALHRLRRRLGELVRAGIADLVADPADVEDEVDALLQALAD